jgi:hypothetical protein
MSRRSLKTTRPTDSKAGLFYPKEVFMLLSEDGATKPNLLFPKLHRHILSVALRELLLLDGSIDSFTCQLQTTKAAVYLIPER